MSPAEQRMVELLARIAYRRLRLREREAREQSQSGVDKTAAAPGKPRSSRRKDGGAS